MAPLTLRSGCPNLGGVYVCHCMAVTDRTIEDAIDHGATSIEALAARCGAGADCGGCWMALEELLDAHLDRSAMSNVA